MSTGGFTYPGSHIVRGVPMRPVFPWEPKGRLVPVGVLLNPTTPVRPGDGDGGGARVARPAARKEPESMRQARTWENVKNRYLVAGLCARCASQLAWGHECGFTTIAPPCDICQCMTLPAFNWFDVHADRARKWLARPPVTVSWTPWLDGTRPWLAFAPSPGPKPADCPDCRITWAGSKPEHCAACHETFTGTEAGNRHRLGDWNDDSRRCLNAEEMRAAGLGQNDRGIWQRVRPTRVPRDVGRAALQGRCEDPGYVEVDVVLAGVEPHPDLVPV